MTSLGPLRFVPIFKHYLWGGTRLQDLLAKPCGDRITAESWEVCDRHDDQSRVAEGPWQGANLSELMQRFGPILVGADAWSKISATSLPANLQGRFPLLFKVLDANQALSVQVHPNDLYASGLAPPDLGKTEAWYVSHADPGAKIYAGLRSGVDAADLKAAIDCQRVEDVLHAFEPQLGDTVFIPAGTLHALGAGLMIAEIQQASNSTFRVYDWGRVDAGGKSRMLHIDQAMDVIDFSAGPVEPIRSSKSGPPFSPGVHQPGPLAVDSINSNYLSLGDGPMVSREALVKSEFFELSRIRFQTAMQLAGDNQFHLLHVTQGQMELHAQNDTFLLKRGETLLLPASSPAVQLTSAVDPVEFLEIHLPRGD